MHLVHVTVRTCSFGAQLPSEAPGLIFDLAESDEDGPVEHVTAHPHALPDPVVGVYVLADSLAEAERRTEALCRRAFQDVRALRDWRVTRVGVPLLTPYYEQLLHSSSGLAGRIGPGPFPST
ncbi:hypothetical protein [Streptomyces sp. RerS4]|uniref:hypothetical protein n=1 Tax=Streptomyces sp. RerS4 TaxID=2942449 RepID=UPI00201C1CA6|nr:hypothetical protein [Streptomyces sp. RerS4]UQX02338.1 hypothetical protein M4D82_18965 [Streptomyces sp. RerS4]